MQTKATFRLICANIIAAEREAELEVAGNGRIAAECHL